MAGRWRPDGLWWLHQSKYDETATVTRLARNNDEHLLNQVSNGSKRRCQPVKVESTLRWTEESRETRTKTLRPETKPLSRAGPDELANCAACVGRPPTSVASTVPTVSPETLATASNVIRISLGKGDPG
jgi:hypothetical protein